MLLKIPVHLRHVATVPFEMFRFIQSQWPVVFFRQPVLLDWRWRSMHGLCVEHVLKSTQTRTQMHGASSVIAEHLVMLAARKHRVADDSIRVFIVKRGPKI